MAKSTVEIELVAQVAEATKAVKRFADDTQKQLNVISISTAVSGIAAGFNLARDALRPLVEFLGDSINEAVEAERATLALANSMRVVGDFSEEALAQFKGFADELARTSSLSDDQVIANVALAKSFGLTNEEAKKVVAVAADLSALTGDSLPSSVEKLAKSYNGFVDKSLKQLVRGLGDLTEAQKANGDVVELVGARASGSANQLRGGFGGAVNEVSKAFSEFKEEIGTAITTNETFIAALRATAEAIIFVTKNIGTFGTAVKVVFTAIINPAEGVAQAFRAIKDGIFGASEQSKILLSDIEKIKLANNSTVKANDSETRIKAERQASLIREKALDDFNKIRSEIEKSGLSDIQKINKEAFDKIKTIRAAIDSGAIANTRSLQNSIANIELDRIKKVAEEQKKITEKTIAEEKKLREEALANVKEISGNPGGALVSGKINTPTDGAAAGLGFVNTVLKGAEGAKDLVSKTIGGIADTILPGIGGVVSEIVGVLAQGPEKVKEFITSFTDAIPGIVVSIIESIPVLIESLVKAVPILIQRLIAAVPELVQALVRQLPDLISALALQAPTIAIAIVQGIVQNIPEMVEGFAKEFLKIPERFAKALLDAINPVSGGDNGFLGTGGKGSGPLGTSGVARVGLGVITGGLSEIGGALGLFAEGGRVPNESRFSGDRFPARLSAGEQVFSQDLSAKLENFLAGGGNAGGGAQPDIVINIGLQQFARIMYDARRAGYQI